MKTKPGVIRAFLLCGELGRDRRGRKHGRPTGTSANGGRNRVGIERDRSKKSSEFPLVLCEVGRSPEVISCRVPVSSM